MAFAFLCLASAIGAVSTGKAARGFYDDKGQRYTPSHTVKNAKCYRYYVAHRAQQVVRAAFLAPDLVEAVLQGRQPVQLTLRRVMKDLPWDWSEQRRRFGLAPGINDSLSVRD